MCIIQNHTFVINGTIPSLQSCQAKQGDRIELKIDVTFESNDIGLSAKIGSVILFPDNVEIEFHAPTYDVTNEGTQTFIIDITNTSILNGTYALVGSIVYDYTIITQKCISTTPSYGCSILTMSGGCSGCNPSTSICILDNCIPKNYLVIAAIAYAALSLIKR